MTTSQTSVETTVDPNRAESNPRTVNGRARSIWSSHLEKLAIIFYDDDDRRSSLTNGQLKDLAERLASLFNYHGVRRGDVVCNMLPNSLEREVVNFGILLTGAVVMFGETITDEGHHFWEPLITAEVKYIVVDPSVHSKPYTMLEKLFKDGDNDIERVTDCVEMPQLQKIFRFRLAHEMKGRNRGEHKSTFEIIKSHPGVFIERVSAHEPAAIFVQRCPVQKHYRMVLRTHMELCQIAHRVEDMLQVTHKDTIYNDLPLSGLPGLPFNYFISGCTMVKSTLCYCPPSKVVAQTWKLLETERCTMAALAPSMIQMLSSHCEDLPEPKWQLRAITTGGLVRQSVMDAIGACTDSIIICYSLVEAGIVSRLVVTEKNKARYSEGCVGDLSNPIRTKFDGNHKESKIGEVLLQGKLVCKEYHRNPALTKAAFTKDGFLLTGDLGFIGERTSSAPSQLYVLGRKADAIIRGNTAIYPREIEEKVNQCPGIWKVKVVSIKDDKGVVQMCACVVPRSQDAVTIDRVKEFCRYQLGGTYDDDDNPHMPTYVFFFDDFPMRHGNVNKRLLGYMASEIIHDNVDYEN